MNRQKRILKMMHMHEPNPQTVLPTPPPPKKIEQVFMFMREMCHTGKTGKIIIKTADSLQHFVEQ